MFGVIVRVAGLAVAGYEIYSWGKSDGEKKAYKFVNDTCGPVIEAEAVKTFNSIENSLRDHEAVEKYKNLCTIIANG